METTAKVIEACDWIPVAPTIRQLQFLSLPHREAFYGGAAGGGKSEALLMGALMYADFPGYAAILFRKTFTDLSLDGALMDRAEDWLSGKGARWNERDKRWEFPSGATLTFGYLDSPRDWRRYDSAEFQYIGFDEATQLRAHDYNALIGRLRRKQGTRIPLRIRAASNPGDESHEFFGERFVNPREPHPDRAFIPALLEDNPHLDRDEYEATLESLGDADPTLYRQRRFGEWILDEGEAIFKPEWWRGRNRYDSTDHRIFNASLARWASLDTAETVGKTSAYTALVVGDLRRGYDLPIRYVAREKLEFPDLIEWVVAELAPYAGPHSDRKFRGLLIENASSGRQLIQTLRASGPQWLRNKIIPVKADRKKEERWKAASVWTKRGMTPLPHPSENAPWLYEFEKELTSVPNSTFVDQADSYSQLVYYLANVEENRPFVQRWHALLNRAA